MDDVVAPEGATFALPISFLAYHDSRLPIGEISVVNVTAAGISIEAEVPSEADVRAANGALDYINTAWQQIKLRLIRGLSIGFRPLEWEPIKGSNGFLFKKWEWLELSAVAIPAQPDATIETIKAFAHRSAAAASGNRAASNATASRAASGTTANQQPGKIMKLSERIEAKQNEISGYRDQIATLSAAFSDRDPTDDEAVQLEELSAQVETASKALDTLTKAETALAVRSQTPAGQGAQILLPRRHVQRAAKADLIFKSACCVLVAHADKRNYAEVCKARYPGDDEVAMMVKAAVNPADTVTPGWAAELVGQQIAEFVDVLAAVSVYGALASQSLRVTFDRNGIIKVPSRNKVPNLAGVFVGEGGAIPVKKGSLTSVSMLPHKAAVISTFTRELAQLANPSIEAVIREGIIEDTGTQIDTNLLDAVAASAIRPAGLLNGVALIPSSGNSAANIATDMRALLDAITAAGGGRRIALILHPSRVVGLSTVTNATGQFLFRDEVANGTLFGASLIVSTNVAPDHVIAVDAADFVTATGDSPEWNVSDVATIHEEDTAPLPIVDGAGVAAKPVRSLWQTASIGIRMIWPLTWAMRRAGMVAALSGVGW